jgi:thiol-disulfide isomerase/thioredoxin
MKNYLVLLLFTIVILSCKNGEEAKPTISGNSKIEGVENEAMIKNPDSISVSVNFKGKGMFEMNFLTSLLDVYTINYNNESSNDTVITKKIKRQSYGQDIFFFTFSFSENKLKQHIYTTDSNTSMINFVYDKGDIFLENDSHVFNLYNLEKNYRAFQNKVDKSKGIDKSEHKQELGVLFKNFDTTNDTILKKINTYYYINTLQKIDPFDEEIEQFIYKLKNPIINGNLRSILFLYVKSRFELLSFNDLNITSYPPDYIKNLALGVYIYLEANKNNDDIKLKEVQNWLMSTEFYDNHRDVINSNTTPFDKKLFTQRLKNLDLQDSWFNKLNLAEIVQQNPSEYYLIDFWATWCGPCIKGIETMKKLTLPENIKVLSLSVNRVNVKDTWKEKSKELGLEVSYLVEHSNSNSEFKKMIDLSWIPRYILVDENLNLLNDKFPHPSDPNFLKGLNSLQK